VKVEKPVKVNKIVYYSVNILMIPLVIALVIGAARGGYKHSTRPITISNAARYVESPRDVAIVLNTPFSIFRTFNKKALVKYKFFDDEKLNNLYNPIHIPLKTKPFTRDNVVIIILESFAREYIGSLNHSLEGGTYKGYTPFIDSLISVSLTFDVSIANGKKSIDAMPSILASVPSLETPYTISHYANNQIDGLPALLKKKGYYSAYFHGAPNGSMGFDSFAKMAGFDNYIGLNEYPEKADFDGVWGVWDEPFFKFFGEKLNSFKQPFLASIFSVSSHHPFKVPEKYTGKFKKGSAPILEVVGYSDFALKEFFNEISKAPWFKNTLFVITADHTNESVHKEFQNNFGSYSIPIVFFKAGSDLRGIKNRIAQQIDIMPTVLSYLNYDEDYFAFGNNLLDDSYESFAFNTSGSTYHLYMKDHILEMSDNIAIGLFNYKTDLFLENNLLGRNPDLQLQMEDKLKAIIQSYNSRLVDNNMIIRKPD
jgi:phosphoglycerol transferase MdoB-like AlkP superfamily enzyme